MFVLKSISRKKYFLLIVTLVLALITLFVLKTYTKKGVISWRTYKNSGLGYKIQYPLNWFVKEDRSGCGFKNCLENLYIENKIGSVTVAGGGPPTETGSSFKIVIIDSPGISSIEEWIQGLYFSSDERISSKIKQKRLNSVATIEIAGSEKKVWKGSGSSDAGMEFIHEGRFYRLHYMSGSQKQFKKDLATFEKMLTSFRIR